MKPKRVALLTLVFLTGLAAVLIGLTWREVQQARLNHALTVALQSDATDRVTALLRRGADPNARVGPERPLTWHILLDRLFGRSGISTKGDTALLIATRNRNRSEVDSLLHAGANPNATNSEHEAPLAVALNDNLHCDLPLIRNLLMHGANPNTRMIDIEGTTDTTPLVKTINSVGNLAARRSLVTLMLKRGANVNATDESGQSPLLAAISIGEAEIAHGLMERGADINHANQDRATPLSACGNSDRDHTQARSIMAELLRRGADVAPAHNGGWSLLDWAIVNDNVTALQIALDHGIPANSHDDRQRTPLMSAAAYGGSRVVERLLDYGAAVNAHDANGWTALMFAAQHGDVATLRTLLQHGADPRIRDREHGWTAAQRAAWVGQDEVAHWLSQEHPLGVTPPAEVKRAWEDTDAGEEDPLARVPVDAHRTIVISRPDQAGDYQAVVTDDRGRYGKPYELSWYIPRCRVFADTDGRRFAWFIALNRMHSQYLVEIDKLDLRERGECPSTYDSRDTYCQPLPGGGALLVLFFFCWQQPPIPARHKDDRVGFVTRFRNGKLSEVRQIFLP
jgi:ankyrin repeat protein